MCVCVRQRCLVLDMTEVPSMDQTAVRHIDKLRQLTQTGLPPRRLGAPAEATAPAGTARFTVALCGVLASVLEVAQPHLRGGDFGFFFLEGAFTATSSASLS